jgi:hypothetical protein
VYEVHKKKQNVIIGHCYGAVHTLHLIKWLRGEGRAAEVVGVVMMSLGARAPASIGLLGKVPAFILEWLRPLGRASSNRALFTPHTDPTLIQSENFMSNNNRMYVMKVGLPFDLLRRVFCRFSVKTTCSVLCFDSCIIYRSTH